MASELRHTGDVARFALVVLVFLGCSSPAKPPVEPVTPPPVPLAGDPSCPLLVPGTSISAEDSDLGPAWVFVTTGDVTAVRARGAALAGMHNDRVGDPGSMGLTISGKAKAKATDVDGGVRVTFQPEDPATAAALGDELRMHAKHLGGASSCEMHH